MFSRKLRLAALAIAPAMALTGLATAPTTHAAPPAHANHNAKDNHAKNNGGGYGTTVTDLGNTPATFMIAQETLKNRNFRTAAWTATDLQVTLMSIPVGGDVGLEVHHGVDQFFRVESGTARVMMGTEEAFTFVKDAGAGDVILIPDGTWHNIVNTGMEPLKLYSLYGPAEHPEGTVHRTQADDPHAGDPKPNPTVADVTPTDPFMVDPGGGPFVFNIEDATDGQHQFPDRRLDRGTAPGDAHEHPGRR